MGFTFEPYDGAKDYTTIGYIMGAGTRRWQTLTPGTGRSSCSGRYSIMPTKTG